MTKKNSFPPDHPLRRHIPDTEQIIGFCREYGLGELLNVDGELGGLFNVNLKIMTTSGRFVIRVMSGLADEAHIRYTERLISVLREAGVPALAPLNDRSGRSYSIWNGRIVQVAPFVDGISFNRTPHQAESSGRMLRKMHDALVHEKAGPLPRWSNYPSKSILEEGMNLLRTFDDGINQADKSRVYRLYDRVMERWNGAERILPQTIIHGDWHPWNQLYDNNGDICCVMDFDFMQRAERIHDAAYALWAMLPDPSLKELAGPFLRGYGRMTPEESELLPAAVARASLFFVCTASFTPDPAHELQTQLTKQEPFIEWILSEDGGKSIRSLLG